MRGQGRGEKSARFLSEQRLPLTELPYCYNCQPCKGEDAFSDALAAALRRAIKLYDSINYSIVFDVWILGSVRWMHGNVGWM